MSTVYSLACCSCRRYIDVSYRGGGSDRVRLAFEPAELQEFLSAHDFNGLHILVYMSDAELQQQIDRAAFDNNGVQWKEHGEP